MIYPVTLMRFTHALIDKLCILAGHKQWLARQRHPSAWKNEPASLLFARMEILICPAYAGTRLPIPNGTATYDRGSAVYVTN